MPRRAIVLLAFMLATLGLAPGGAFAASAQVHPLVASLVTPPVWTELAPATSPPARFSASMAFDPVIGKLILFWGRAGFDILDDTWAFDGSTWTKLSPSVSPSPRIDAPMVFDPAIGRLVLFGGHDDLGGIIGDTWTFDGTTWTELNPSVSPPARWLASMSYDPAIGQLVLFGGYDDSVNPLSDTWAFDGTTWTELSPPASPDPRACASMAFDPITHSVVLFGGGSPSAGWFSDTWAFDGTTWTELSPAQSPTARLCASLAFDPTTSDLVLFGGFFPDTWSFDGTTWTDVSPTTSPVARNYAPMTFDPNVGQLVLFGGMDNLGNALSDTWTFGTAGALGVTIDIKPGSTTNPIKLSSTGKIPVAILSTSTFDATTVASASACFGDAQSPAERDCTALNRSVEDINGDGLLDLMLRFKTRDTGIDPEDIQACLTGMTSSIVSVEGCDSIKTL